MLPKTLRLAAVAAVAAAADAGPSPAPAKDLGSVLKANPDLSTYYDLIQQYPQVLLQLPNIAGVTIVAPSNEAFKNIPFTSLNGIWNTQDNQTTISLLQYHILQGTVDTGALPLGPTIVKPTLLTDPAYTNVTGGQNVLIDVQPGGDVVLTTSMGTRCTVVDADNEFQGGLVQVIDNLLVPPARLNVTAHNFKVVDFLGGLYAADIMPGVQDEARDITVFAPTDKAMALVGGGLEGMDPAQLKRVMGYHVVQGKVLVSSTLTNGSRLTTLASNSSAPGQDLSLTVRQSGNNMYVNSAQIIQSNILIANGIMHIISDVLNPDARAALPNATAVTQDPVFPISSAKNPFTSALPCTADCPTPTSAASNSTTTSGSFFTSSSRGAAGGYLNHHQAMATGQVVMGAALGVLALI